MTEVAIQGENGVESYESYDFGGYNNLNLNATPCDICAKVFTTKWSMQEHRDSVHEGIRFLCDHCDHIASSKRNLRGHMGKKHPDHPLPAQYTSIKADDAGFPMKGNYIVCKTSFLEFQLYSYSFWLPIILQATDGAIMIYHKLDLMTEKTENYLFNFPLVWSPLINKKLCIMPLNATMTWGEKLHFAEKSNWYSHNRTVHQSVAKLSSTMVLQRFIPCSITKIPNLLDIRTGGFLFVKG